MAGYDFKIQLYTVPGQVQYNATRRVVLAGADAVVFVADSRRGALKENQAAFENMKVNLLANRLVPEKVPLVIQYNKQDLPDLLPVAELDRALNPWSRSTFPDGRGRGPRRDGGVHGGRRRRCWPPSRSSTTCARRGSTRRTCRPSWARRSRRC